MKTEFVWGPAMFRGGQFEARASKFLRIALAARYPFLAAVIGLPSVNSLAQMTLPGTLDVSQSGAATYSISIPIPPGVNGVEPKLALRYSSQGANGLLGVGWSLEGFSQITRCSRNPAQDGARSAVTNDVTDKYCLDGQRLVVVSGTDGADGALYRTEIEKFSSIKSTSANDAIISNGPGAFQVKTKSGLTLQYGTTSNSRLTVQGSSPAIAYVWKLDKVSDIKGNSYSVTYLNDAANGQSYPAVINYGSNASQNQIRFEYDPDANGQPQARPDVISGYSSGGIFKTAYRLTKIKTAAGDIGITYVLLADGRSRVNTIASSCNVGTCMPPSQFWVSASGSSTFSGYTAELRAGGFWNDQRWLTGDVNGDGLIDLINIYSASAVSGGAVTIDVHLNNGQNFTGARWFTGTAAFTNDQRWFVADVNGDGLDDLVNVFNDNGQASIDIYKSLGAAANGVGFTGARAETRSGGIWDAQKWLCFDVNGDGLPDLVNVYSSTGQDGGLIQIDVHINNGLGTGFTGARWLNGNAAFTAAQNWLVADFDRDGLPDLANVFNSNGAASIDVYLNKGAPGNNFLGFVGKRWENGSGVPFYAGANQKWFVGDVNGDGYPDLVSIYGVNSGNNLVMKSYVNSGRGNFIFENWSSTTAAFWSAQKWFVADVDGDGLSDFVNVFNDAGLVSIDVYKSTGSSTKGFVGQRVVTRSAGYWDDQKWFAADANGDGAGDLINVYVDSNQASTAVYKNIYPRSEMASISDGLKTYAIDYKTLTSALGTQYTISAPSAYPSFIVRGPIRVASTVSKPNGSGGTNTVQYGYGNLAAELGVSARGLLGFQWIQSLDMTTGLVSRTTYRQDYPFTGQIASTAKGTSASNWNNLGQTQYQYTCIDFVSAPASTCILAAGKRYFVYPSIIDSTGNKDLTATNQPGAGLPGSHATQAMDNWGNVTQTVVQTLDASGTATDFSKTTNNVYSPVDMSNWFLGRLLRTTTTATAH